MRGKIKIFYSRNEVRIFAVLSFLIPLIIYILTLERKLVGGDTTWYALLLPEMQIMVPTGYPTFSIFGKLFTLLPFGDIAYRLNLLSAVFGAPSVMILFLATNKIIKNALISFASALTFAFLYSYWTIANRLEFDTINSFFIALILYSMFLYAENPVRKYFYFFAAALGLSLTNHPIAFFIMPAFLLYVILVNPKMFKSAKAVLLGILFFLMPLTLYAWLPIRSLQGYGPVTSARTFIYYIAGRDITGKIHGGSFVDKNMETFSKVFSDFFTAIYSNYGIILLILAVAGLAYLFKKNWKFASSSVLIIIFNIIIISLYLPYCPPNYALNAMMIISVYLAFGFLLIYDSARLIIEKLRNISASKSKTLKIAVSAVLLVLFLISPAFFAVKNYKKADFSKPLEIYVFWNEIFDQMEDNSVLYVSSSAANIGEFINRYERQDKNITIISNKDQRYSPENIRKDIAEGKKIYFLGIEDKLKAEFNVEKITGYTWKRMQEYIVFYNYTGEKKDLEVQYEIMKTEMGFGEKFEVSYTILNENDEDLEITSLELALTGSVDFIGVSQKGDIDLEPSLSQGKYMWVKTLPIKAKSKINIILILQASSPGDAEINFAVTSQNYYFEADEIDLDIFN